MKGLVLGWGTNSDNESSQHLNKARMTFASRRDCIKSNLLFGLLPENAYCANTNGTSQIVCSGDSGGGMVSIKSNKMSIKIIK